MNKEEKIEPMSRLCDRPMYSRTLERVDVIDLTQVQPLNPRPWLVVLTFDTGLGAQFRFKTRAGANRCWRKLVGLGK